MRRDVGMVLAGLGTFLIVLAIALPTYIAPHVIKFPLNYFYSATLVGPDSTYFSASEVHEVTGADLHAIYTIDGDGPAGNSSTAVWNLFTYLYDTGLPKPQQEIEIQTTKVAFDRKNADLRNCCGANFMGKNVNWSGIVGYVFPMNTQKTTYNVYNTTTMSTIPFVYSGTAVVDGITAYEFTGNLKAPVKIGFSPLSSADPEYYNLQQTYWVDPDTGALLKVLEHEDAYLINPITGATTYTLLDTTLAPTAQSVSDIVGIDNSGRLKITLFQTVIPIVSGVLGAILLVSGILLARRRRPDVIESGFGETTGELATAAPPDAPAPETAQTAAPADGKAAASGPPPAGRRGGKHAAGSTVGIVPGLESTPAEAAAPESGDGKDPEASA